MDEDALTPMDEDQVATYLMSSMAAFVTTTLSVAGTRAVLNGDYAGEYADAMRFAHEAVDLAFEASREAYEMLVTTVAGIETL